MANQGLDDRWASAGQTRAERWRARNLGRPDYRRSNTPKSQQGTMRYLHLYRGLPGWSGISPIGIPYSQARRDVATAKEAYLKKKAADEAEAAANGWRITVPPFSGRQFNTFNPVPNLQTIHRDDVDASSGRRYHEVRAYELSSVLAQPTIWLPHQSEVSSGRTTYSSNTGIVPEMRSWPGDVEEEAPVAEWPTQGELEYEGQQRIATERSYRRSMPVPRVETDPSVNWGRAPYLRQHPFDRVYAGGPHVPSDEDIHFYIWEVSLADILNQSPYGTGNEEDIYNHLLGADLMKRLNPEGIYSHLKDW